MDMGLFRCMVMTSEVRAEDGVMEKPCNTVEREQEGEKGS